jgi:hypothetical protein
MRIFILKIFFGLGFLFFVNSCSKDPAKVLPSKKGNWIYNSVVTTTNSSNAEVKTNNYVGGIKFNKSTYNKNDLVGYTIDEGGWNYEGSSHKIYFTPSNGNPYFVIVSNEDRNSETWTQVSSEVSFGVTYTYTTVYKLTRQN